jgi:hypothetical protein
LRCGVRYRRGVFIAFRLGGGGACSIIEEISPSAKSWGHPDVVCEG